MKIKMHYAYGKQAQVACGRRNVFITTNYREITCKKCLKTHVHRNSKILAGFTSPFNKNDTKTQV